MKYVAIPLVVLVPVPNIQDFEHDLPDLYQALEEQALTALSEIGNRDVTAFVADDFETAVFEKQEGHDLPSQLTGVCPPSL